MQKLSGICSSLGVYSTFVVIAIALCSCMTVVTMIVKSGTHLQEFRVQVAFSSLLYLCLFTVLRL